MKLTATENLVVPSWAVFWAVTDDNPTPMEPQRKPSAFTATWMIRSGESDSADYVDSRNDPYEAMGHMTPTAVYRQAVRFAAGRLLTKTAGFSKTMRTQYDHRIYDNGTE